MSYRVHKKKKKKKKKKNFHVTIANKNKNQKCKVSQFLTPKNMYLKTKVKRKFF